MPGEEGPVRFEVPTFEEVLALVGSANARRREHPVGVYPETKHPSYFEGLGLPLEKPLLAALRAHALDIRPQGLREIVTHARGIGVHKSLATPTLVRDAHAAGLLVHVWTLRAENTFLPVGLWRGIDPRAHGDMAGEATSLLKMGVDGYFTDYPAIGVAAWDAFRPKP